MSADDDRLSEQTSLLTEAFRLCILLQNYTEENFDVFTSDNDENIIEVIDKREELIGALADIDCKLDGDLSGASEYARGKSLPPDLEKLRCSISAVLNAISVRDMQIIKIISGRMQTYRNETLKARSKQNLSAYMRSAGYTEMSGNIDLSN